MTDNLTPDVRALLAAIHEALDIPLPGMEDADERAYQRILTERAGVARIALDSVLTKGHTVSAVAVYVTERTAETPVTYTAYEPQQQ